ncbi:MAG: ATP-binding protein [Ignavibacteriales bacterium]
MFPKIRRRSFSLWVILLFSTIGLGGLSAEYLWATGKLTLLANTTPLKDRPTWFFVQSILFVGVVLFISGALWNRSLHTRVASQTRELARELGARREAEEKVRQQNDEVLATYQALHSSYGTVALMAKELAASQNNLLTINTQLASSNALYRSLFSASENPILVLDQKDFDILDANLVAEDASGYSLNELKNMSLVELIDRSFPDRSQILEEIRSTIMQDGNITFEGKGKRKNNEEAVPVRIHLSMVPFEDTQVVLATLYDLTDQIKREQEREKLIKYQQEAQKMTTLSIMSAGVVHEIAQPLNAIKILADGMIFWQENGREIALNDAFDTFHKISAQAERINDVIIHMRNLANAFDESELSPCAVNEAITDAIKLIRSQLASHGISLKLDLDPNLPETWGQNQRLEEIMLNLITNAMRALSDQDSDKTILCTTSWEDDQIIIEIADNGPGINPEIAEHIWEPFFSTRLDNEAMGLGLVIVHSIVSRLGGTIDYYQNIQGGATFRILLPSIEESVHASIYPYERTTD